MKLKKIRTLKRLRKMKDSIDAGMTLLVGQITALKNMKEHIKEEKFLEVDEEKCYKMMQLLRVSEKNMPKTRKELQEKGREINEESFQASIELLQKTQDDLRFVWRFIEGSRDIQKVFDSIDRVVEYWEMSQKQKVLK